MYGKKNVSRPANDDDKCTEQYDKLGGNPLAWGDERNKTKAVGIRLFAIENLGFSNDSRGF